MHDEHYNQSINQSISLSLLFPFLISPLSCPGPRLLTLSVRLSRCHISLFRSAPVFLSLQVAQALSRCAIGKFGPCTVFPPSLCIWDLCCLLPHPPLISPLPAFYVFHAIFSLCLFLSLDLMNCLFAFLIFSPL